MEPDVDEKTAEIRKSLEAIRRSVQPNEPIESFQFPDSAAVSDWLARFERLSRENLIEEITSLMLEMELPVLDVADTRHDHLVTYHQISQLRENARSLLSVAMAKGYPHTLDIIARTNEVAPDLTDIAGALDRIQARIDIIANQTLPNVSDGVAITVGPISVTLNALKLAAVSARQKIHLNAPDVNVSALIIAISRIGDISNKISEQLNKVIRQIPKQVRLALNEIIRSANSIADRGIDLLRTVRSRNAAGGKEKVSHAGDHLGAEQAAQKRRQSAVEAGEALKAARVAASMDLADISRHMKVYPGYVRSIEKGDFKSLPGRTYAIAWVRQYAKFVGLDPKTLSDIVRAELPPAWHPGTEG